MSGDRPIRFQPSLMKLKTPLPVPENFCAVELKRNRFPENHFLPSKPICSPATVTVPAAETDLISSLDVVRCHAIARAVSPEGRLADTPADLTAGMLSLAGIAAIQHQGKLAISRSLCASASGLLPLNAFVCLFLSPECTHCQVLFGPDN
jgi:hypothetical protein